MRDAADAVLYVGKAKNLRRRLGSYRVANPDRMPRRHLRMLRSVTRIEVEQQPDEASALARESELLRALKPRFNRAGTWSSPSRFFAWRQTQVDLELTVLLEPVSGWAAYGPLGAGAEFLRNALARLLWCALHPERGPIRLPCGWVNNRLETIARCQAAGKAEEADLALSNLFSGAAPTFEQWLRAQWGASLVPCAQALIDADLELVRQITSVLPRPPSPARPRQFFPGPARV